jgi:hypothetical protein
LKQAVCHEPHHKQYKVKGKAQGHVPKWRTEKDGVDNTETRDDDAIDDTSINIRLRHADKVNKT